jgi:hypothetical protein
MRTRLTAAQLLGCLGTEIRLTLLRKHELRIRKVDLDQRLAEVLQKMNGFEELVDELVRTKDALRTQVSPRYMFDTYWRELERALSLDGFRVTGTSLTPIDPAASQHPLTEDLTSQAVKESGVTGAMQITSALDKSSEYFVNEDFNSSLTQARIALETLLRRMAHGSKPGDPPTWGNALSDLLTSGRISEKQEKALAGVYGFISQGAHQPLDDEEWCRLGRHLAFSMCFYLSRLSGAP